MGAHWRGRLCTDCEDDEIAAYHERLYGGRRRQARAATLARAQAKAANTCKCEAQLAEPLCFNDREILQNNVRQESHLNAGPNGWLRHMELDPVTGKAHYVMTPALHAIQQANRVANGFHLNACRCGSDIAGAGPGTYGPNNVPVPVAFCTACNGTIIDVNHARVTGWQAKGRSARTGLRTETNLRLPRAMIMV